MKVETQLYLKAYADGINEYAERNPLPLQFHLTWNDFHPWTPEDSCSYIKLMQFQLSLNWNYELLRDYLIVVTQDEKLVNDILPYKEEHGDKLIYTVNDDELKDLGMFKETHETTWNPRKPNPDHYKQEEENATLHEDLGVKENKGISRS